MHPARAPPWCWRPGSARACGRSTDTIPKPLVQVGGKALIDYVLDRLADAGVERAVVNVHHLADQIERHLAAAQRPQIVISDERERTARHRRRRGQGAAAARRRAVLPRQFRHHLDRRRDAQSARGSPPPSTPRAMDALLLLAPTTTSIGYTGRGDFAMAAGRPARAARRARGGAVRLCRRRDPHPGVLCGCRRAAPSSMSPAVRPRGRDRAAVRPAARGSVDACRHARRRRSRRSGAPRQRGLMRPPTGRRACMIAAWRFDPRVFTIPASAPFLPTLIAALLDGALCRGLRAGAAIRWRSPAPRSICRRGAPAGWRATASSM